MPPAAGDDQVEQRPPVRRGDAGDPHIGQPAHGDGVEGVRGVAPQKIGHGAHPDSDTTAAHPD
ncbi:hypothetical protein [Actinacidiphila glaucinigra]|uniref:hypothetical protein n=1 Tax=Actinacidiphila glaucinigra TaxID=235986 RepID=UPI002E3085AB|nr:hypothetical protein [Actinacidiphila glaucinigra]